jgi:hypothetical protein
LEDERMEEGGWRSGIWHSEKRGRVGVASGDKGRGGGLICDLEALMDLPDQPVDYNNFLCYLYGHTDRFIQTTNHLRKNYIDNFICVYMWIYFDSSMERHAFPVNYTSTNICTTYFTMMNQQATNAHMGKTLLHKPYTLYTFLQPPFRNVRVFRKQN